MSQASSAQLTEAQWREILVNLEKTRFAVEKAFFGLDRESSPDVFNQLKGSMVELTRMIERIKLMLEVVCPNENNAHSSQNLTSKATVETVHESQRLTGLTSRVC
jgi:hypothetical protein